tara:strand:- start:121 stop:255 length:135 start_codon:yes stop_codon:yes gene_type:complete
MGGKLSVMIKYTNAEVGSAKTIGISNKTNIANINKSNQIKPVHP